MAVETGCLYSTLKNVSGVRMSFPFIPPHGRELAANEQISVPGDIRQTLLSRGPGRSDRRMFDAFVRALGNNDDDLVLLQLVSTPAPIVYDETDELSYMITSDNATVGVASPCWEVSV